MSAYDEMLGRAIIAAAGLTPQARGRMLTMSTFRTGGPRTIRPRPDIAQDVEEDMVSVMQPLPDPLRPKTAQLRGGGNGDGMDGPLGGKHGT